MSSHLTPVLWAEAERQLIRKALAEFSHERLLSPQPLGDGPAPLGPAGTGETPSSVPSESSAHGEFSVRSDDGGTEYRFRARILALDHWHIPADSITRHRGTEELPLDALEFFIELREVLGLSDAILPVYLEEISSTLSSTAYKLARQAEHPVSAAQLAASGFQDIETGMTEGHPCFVANNGRLGFGSDEYLSYAPEAASPVRLIWLAARRDHATFSAGAGLDYESLIRAELGAETLERFAATMTGLGLDLDAYFLIPVHPWQWRNKLSVTFAAEVAKQRLVLLGHGDDSYLAQQSIRTFFNTSDPAKHYVKTALSVLNMGFMRGLSAAYMEATPAINDWLGQLIESDPLLKATGLTIIRERASIGYHHRQYEQATVKGSPYRKMLAALWRESPVPSLEPGERLATMASLLHTDRDGASFAGALIAESGLEPAVWLRRYLDAYFTPLLHSFYAYDLVYMPHGENVILVIEDGVVRRAVYKDIAEEIAVMDPDAVLPPDVERVRADVPDDMKLLSLFTDVFDCFFRFLGATLATDGVLGEDEFWQTVGTCVRDYQSSVPQLADKFRQYDLFAPEFALSCLNRLQLRNNQQMVDLQDPAGALQLSGTLKNPIA
ncbi:IucA/IucC family siderophore biosynthesis protein [Streptomyces sp. NBC_00144]|uniref:IucA/IucC family protein n=1 Tax=unclassified Streptomyces TaxID=2593676 RepID=UPI00324B8C27|nr:IucA/IucC family siderophore biosynthesis protein [Streptomyces sp. NBC_00932]